jgi:hypothetical protein
MHTPFVFARFTLRASYFLISLTAFRVLLLFSEALLLEESRPPREVAGEVPESGKPREIGFYVLTPTMLSGRDSPSGMSC